MGGFWPAGAEQRGLIRRIAPHATLAWHVKRHEWCTGALRVAHAATSPASPHTPTWLATGDGLVPRVQRHRPAGFGAGVCQPDGGGCERFAQAAGEGCGSCSRVRGRRPPVHMQQGGRRRVHQLFPRWSPATKITWAFESCAPLIQGAPAGAPTRGSAGPCLQTCAGCATLLPALAHT